MKVSPYLYFEGRCDEALGFYKNVLGAEVIHLMRFKDSPEPCPDGMMPPGYEGKVMHATFRIGETELMVSDGMCSGKPQFKGISLSLTPQDPTQAAKLFAALGEGGQVQMPLTKTFFSPAFGMVADRFGVSWMVVVLP